MSNFHRNQVARLYHPAKMGIFKRADLTERYGMDEIAELENSTVKLPSLASV